MVILDTCIGWNSWQAILCDIVFFISLILAGVIGLSFIDEINAIKIAALCICLSVFAIALVGEFVTAETKYKIYLTDMSLEELETEYDVTDIDGLIVGAYKKKGDKNV